MVDMPRLGVLAEKIRKDRSSTRFAWNYKRSQAWFQALFINEWEQTTPSGYPVARLIVTQLGVTAPWSYSFDVHRGKPWWIKGWIEDSSYRRLCQILGLEYDPAHPFRPGDFISDIDSAAYAADNGVVVEAPPSSDSTDDADRIYFVGYYSNPWPNKPRAENKAKTREIFGLAAERDLTAKRISTKWSSKPPSKLSEPLKVFKTTH